jgi:hypothetical protein
LCRTEYRGSQTIKYAGVKCESTCPLGNFWIIYLWEIIL